MEEYINNTPNPEYTKEEIIEKIENVIEEVEQVEEVEKKVEEPEVQEEIVKHNLQEFAEEEPQEEVVVAEEEPSQKVEESKEEVVEVADETQEETLASEEEVMEEVQKELVLDLVEESQDEKVEKKATSLDEDELQDTIAVDVVADLFENAPKKSLNDKLHGDIQIGLNDRIAFVKNLFDGSQEDFNRVISQLNTFKTEKEARKFINKMVKPDYNWVEKEEFEERFMAIVERKFA